MVRSMVDGTGVVGVAIGLAVLPAVLSAGLLTVLLGAFATDGPPWSTGLPLTSAKTPAAAAAATPAPVAVHSHGRQCFGPSASMRARILYSPSGSGCTR